MPGDPATVSRAPVDIIILGVKDVFGGEGCAHHVAPRGVLHPLGLACGPTGVQLQAHTHRQSASWQSSKTACTAWITRAVCNPRRCRMRRGDITVADDTADGYDAMCNIKPVGQDQDIIHAFSRAGSNWRSVSWHHQPVLPTLQEGISQSNLHKQY